MKGTEPRIRFKEFGGAWEADKLSRHLSVSEERNEDNRYGAADVFSVSREHGVVNQIEFQGRSFAGASLLGYRVIHKGQVAYTKSPLKAAPYGIVKADKTKSGSVSALYGVYDAIADADFVQTFFENDDRLNAYLRPLVNKGAKNTLLVSDEDALSGEVRFPSLPEQRRIAELFRNLDETIAATDARLEKLRQSKKSLLEKMFPRPGASVPEIRFKGFKGNWEPKRLSEMFQIRRGLTYSPSDVVEEGIRVLRSSNISTDLFVVSDDDVFVRSEAVTIPFANNGDILVTAANGSIGLVGKHAIISGIKEQTCVHGGFMLLARTEEPEFVQAWLGAPWYRDFIRLYVGGGNGTIGNLNKTGFEEYTAFSPTTPLERKRIGAFFRDFDLLLEATQKRAVKLRQVKSALLEEMFV